MNKQLSFAISMENSILRQTEFFLNSGPAELQKVTTVLIRSQHELLEVLHQCISIHSQSAKYPELCVEQIVGSDSDWKFSLNADALSLTDNLVQLWNIYAMTDKSWQFYQQSSCNSMYPGDSVFMSSVAQLKSMLKRRIDSVLRIIYNQVWLEVGHAPFLLGRD